VAGRAVVFYLSKLVWPFGLSFIYPRWSVDQAQAWQYLFPVAVAAALLALILLRKRIGRGPMIAALFFGGTLFPALGFVDLYPQRFSYVADHFQYIASLGPLSLIAALISMGFRRLENQVRVLVIVTIGVRVLAGLVRDRATVYRNSEALWTDTLEINPNSYLAHSILGNIKLGRGRHSEAIEHYRVALQIKPDDPISLNNLAWGLAVTPLSKDRDTKEAVSLASRAAEITKFGAPALLETLAVAYAADGQFASAIRIMKQAQAIAENEGDLDKQTELKEMMDLFRARRRYDRSVTGN
jgi:tetratricopeptide (TPR) repeat protein